MRFLSIAAAALLWSSAAIAQTPPVGMVDHPCPPPAPLSGFEQTARDALLGPGPIDLQAAARLIASDEAQAVMRAQREAQARDWPNLCKYRAANAALPSAPRPDVVFLGDSITELWGAADPGFFTGGIIDRGISGQTTPQMLLRFEADVIALHPRAVHIMAGTNDVAGNTGPNTEEDYKNNIRAMVTLARAHGVRVILASIPPTARFSWQPALEPAPRIRALNAWLADYAREQKLEFVDYYQALAGDGGALRPELGNDGVHPNRAGYARMLPLAKAAIARSLAGG